MEIRQQSLCGNQPIIAIHGEALAADSNGIKRYNNDINNGKYPYVFFISNSYRGKLKNLNLR